MASLEQSFTIRVRTDGTLEVAKLSAEVQKLGTTAQQATAKAASVRAPDMGAWNSGVQNVTASYMKLAAVAAGAFAAIAGARIFIDGIVKMVSAATEAEDTVVRLQAAIERTGASFADAGPKIEATVQALFKASAFDDESLRRAATTLLTITGSAEKAAMALQPVADLASALGIDLDSASRLVARAAEGAIAGLSRIGIVLTEVEQKAFQAATENERLAIVLDKIRGKVGGAAAAELGTYAGQWKALKNQFGELAESAGRELLPALTLGVNALRAWLPVLESTSGAFTLLANVARVVAGAVSAVFNETLAAITKVVALITQGVEKLVSAAAAVASRLGFEGISEKLSAASQAIQEQRKDLDDWAAGAHVAAVEGAEMLIRGLTGVAPAATQAGTGIKALGKDTEDAGGKITKFAEKVQSAMASLLMRDEGSSVQIAALVGAFEQLNRTFGQDVALKAYGAQLADLDAKLKTMGVNVPAAKQAILDLAVANEQTIATMKASEEAVGSFNNAVMETTGNFAKFTEDAAVLNDEFARLEARGLSTEQIFALIGDRIIKFGGTVTALKYPLAALGGGFDKNAQDAQKWADGVAAAAERVKVSVEALEAEFAAMTVAFMPGGENAFDVQGMIDAIDQFMQRQDTQLLIRLDPTLEGRLKDAARAAGLELANAAAQRLSTAIERLSGILGGAFTDLLTEGGRSFGEIGAAVFKENLNKGLTELFGNAILAALGGAPKRRADESDADFQRRSTQTQVQQAKLTEAFTGVVGAIGQTLQMFENARKGQETSVLGATVGMGITGASVGALFGGFGAIIGALVGAIIGGITAALANAKAKKEQPYAAYGIREGEAYVEAFAGQERQFENVTNAMKTDMLQRMNTVMEETTSDYIKMLLKFPLRISAALQLGIDTFNFAPVMDTVTKKSRGWLSQLLDPLGVNLIQHWIEGTKATPGVNVGTPTSADDGQIGNPNYDKAARKSFLSDFDNWVTNTLPKEIAARFKAQTSQAFEAMGMTAERFGEVWDQLQGMDPKAAMEILNNMTDAVVSFGRLAEFLADVRKQFQLGQRYDAELSITGMARPRGVSDYTQSLIDAGEELIKLGMAIFDLPFGEQAAAAAQLGQRMDVLRANLIQFLNSVIATSKALSESIAEKRFQIKYAGAKTPEEQSALLMNQLRGYEKMITSAASLGLSPQEVQRLTEQAADTIMKLYSLDPEARAAWADAQLAKLDTLQQKTLTALGEAAISAFEAVVDAMEPVIDFFLGLEGAFDNLIDAANGAADAIRGGTPATPQPDEPDKFPAQAQIEALFQQIAKILSPRGEAVETLSEGARAAILAILDQIGALAPTTGEGSAEIAAAIQAVRDVVASFEGNLLGLGLSTSLEDFRDAIDALTNSFNNFFEHFDTTPDDDGVPDGNQDDGGDGGDGGGGRGPRNRAPEGVYAATAAAMVPGDTAGTAESLKAVEGLLRELIAMQPQKEIEADQLAALRQIDSHLGDLAPLPVDVTVTIPPIRVSTDGRTSYTEAARGRRVTRGGV